MLSESETYKLKLRKKHEKSGAFRSGEGTAAEIYERMKKMEEKQRLLKMLETGEQPKEFDPEINQKLFDLFQERYNVYQTERSEEEMQTHHILKAPLTDKYNPKKGRRILNEEGL